MSPLSCLCPAPSNWKVSLARPNRKFNNVVCNDRFSSHYAFCMSRSMYTFYCLSTVYLFESTVLPEDIDLFKNSFVSKFWTPGAVQGYLPFCFDELQTFFSQYHITLCLFFRQGHSKHELESKHGAICSTFLCHSSAAPSSNAKFWPIAAVRVYNEVMVQILRQHSNFSRTF